MFRVFESLVRRFASKRTSPSSEIEISKTPTIVLPQTDFRPTQQPQERKTPVHMSMSLSRFDGQGRRVPARVRDVKNPTLPDLVYGFPDRGGQLVQSAPFTDCTIYYCTNYAAFDSDQRRYYVWWRDRFLAGDPIATTATYLFVAAYEGAVFEQNMRDVLEWWLRLWRAYPDERSFRDYCAKWIDDARALIGIPVYDEVSEELMGQERFDAAIRAGVSPDIQTLIEMTQAWEGIAPSLLRRLRYTMQALRSEAAEDPILAAARAATPVRRERPAFESYYTYDFLKPMMPPNMSVKTWYTRPQVRRAASALFRNAKAFWEAPKADLPSASDGSPHDDLRFVESTGNAQRIPIRRSSKKTANDAETINGLKRTLALMGDVHVLVLMGIVLHLSDVKPYVEGQIVYSREMRMMFERACEALGLPSGLGPYRRSFYYLTQGQHAPWTLEPSSTLTEMKMNTARARFRRGLQRELLGSNPRGDVYRSICDRLSVEMKRPASNVCAGFEAATGVPPFVGSVS